VQNFSSLSWSNGEEKQFDSTTFETREPFYNPIIIFDYKETQSFNFTAKFIKHDLYLYALNKPVQNFSSLYHNSMKRKSISTEPYLPPKTAFIIRLNLVAHTRLVTLRVLILQLSCGKLFVYMPWLHLCKISALYHDPVDSTHRH